MLLKEIFVKNLRKYRNYRGMSQMLLAEKVDTATAYIGQMEIGNRFPSLDMVEKIAKVLEIKPYMLFFDESEGDSIDEIPEIEAERLSDTMKEELISRLTSAVRRVVKQIK